MMAVVAGAPTDLPADGFGARREPVFTEGGVRACLECHSGEGIRAVGAGPHGNAGREGTPYAGRGCEACHGPGSFHVSRAHGGRGFPPMIAFDAGDSASERDEQLRACLDCHDGGARGAPAVGLTGSAHDAPPVRCSSCHRVHAEGEPLRSAPGQAEVCFSCHGAVRDGRHGNGPSGLDFNRMACSNCHRIHPVRTPPVRGPVRSGGSG